MIEFFEIGIGVPGFLLQSHPLATVPVRSRASKIPVRSRSRFDGQLLPSDRNFARIQELALHKRVGPEAAFVASGEFCCWSQALSRGKLKVVRACCFIFCRCFIKNISLSLKTSVFCWNLSSGAGTWRPASQMWPAEAFRKYVQFWNFLQLTTVNVIACCWG